MSAIQELIAQRRETKTPDTWRARMMRLQGELIRARKAANLTQTQMAERLGISRETFQRWEQSRGDPSATNLFRWADILGIVIASSEAA